MSALSTNPTSAHFGVLETAPRAYAFWPGRVKGSHSMGAPVSRYHEIVHVHAVSWERMLRFLHHLGQCKGSIGHGINRESSGTPDQRFTSVCRVLVIVVIVVIVILRFVGYISKRHGYCTRAPANYGSPQIFVIAVTTMTTLPTNVEGHQ